MVAGVAYYPLVYRPQPLLYLLLRLAVNHFLFAVFPKFGQVVVISWLTKKLFESKDKLTPLSKAPNLLTKPLHSSPLLTNHLLTKAKLKCAQLRLQIEDLQAKLCVQTTPRSGYGFVTGCLQTRSRYAAWFVRKSKVCKRSRASKRSCACKSKPLRLHSFACKPSVCTQVVTKAKLLYANLRFSTDCTAKLCLQKLRFCTQKLRFCKTCGVATQHPWVA